MGGAPQEFDLIHNHTLLIAFEFAHLLIFGVSLFYVLTTVVQTKRLNYTNREWKRIANRDTDDLVTELEAQCNAMRAKGEAPVYGPLWKSMFAPGVDIWEDCEWKIMRLIFLQEFDLGTEFDYSKYVKMKLITKLSHSLHVHPSTWGLVCLFSAFIWVGGLFTDRSKFDHVPAPAFQCGCLNDPSRWDDTASYSGRDLEWTAKNYTLNLTATNESELMVPCEPDIVEDGISESEAVIGVLFPALLGWFLLAMQGYVLINTKQALHQVLKKFNVESALDLPNVLRTLDAEVEMRQQLPHIPMFANAGEDFIAFVMECLTLKFYEDGEEVFREGDSGSSMFFICKGQTDVVSVADDNSKIGNLGPGDYTGEMAILLDQPRSKSIIARTAGNTKTAIFELKRDSLIEIGLEFPAAVQRMYDFAESRRQAALAGKWDMQQSLKKEDEEMVAEHSERMKELQRTQDAKKEELGKEFPDGGAIKMVGKMGKKGVSGAVSGVANAAKNPIQTAIEAGKKAAGKAGLPGMGVMKPHSSGHHHQHADRMDGAEDLMPHSRTHLFEELSEISLLFNCFTFGYYFLHMLPVVIGTNFDQGNAVQTTIVRGLANLMVLLPALILMVWMAPISTKYSCLLDNVLYKDEDTIAEVYHQMKGLIQLKNAIKNQLMKAGMTLAHDMGYLDELEIKQIAEIVFKELDDDRSGKLTYGELRQGLTNFSVFLTKKEFKSMMEFVDPDMDKSVDIGEWVQFLSSTDEQLASNEWLVYKQTLAVQKKFSSELTRKMMELHKVDVGQPIQTVDDFLLYIFSTIDTDNGGNMLALLRSRWCIHLT